jgi:hypothetical protein
MAHWRGATVVTVKRVRQARPITDIKSTGLGKNKRLYAFKLFWANDLKERAK